MRKELRVKDLIRKIDDTLTLLDVRASNIFSNYMDWSRSFLSRKAECAVIGILIAYRNELIKNKRQYAKSTEMKKEASLKIKTIESFILEYRILDSKCEKRLPCEYSDSISEKEKCTAEFKRDANIVCDRFEQIYAKQIEDYRARQQKSSEQAERKTEERRKLIEENLKNL